MDKISKMLLEILSDSLSGVKPEAAYLSDPEWVELLNEAEKQTVLPLVFRSVVPCLPEGIKAEWGKRSNAILANNVRIEWEHSEVDELMKSAGIPYVILKGAASAYYYPVPLLRTLGDVDFLVPPEYIEEAKKAVIGSGFTINESEGAAKHYAFDRRTGCYRTTWELHWEPNGIPDSAVGDQIRQRLETIFTESIRVNNESTSYLIPSPEHHGLVTLIHIALHMVNSGVGLRHLLDWSVFADHFADEEFAERFKPMLQNYGLWFFAQYLTLVSCKFLHSKKHTWIEIGPEDDVLEAIMMDIFDGGNFGQKHKNRINQAKLISDSEQRKVDAHGIGVQFLKTMNKKAKMALPVCATVPALLPVGWIVSTSKHLLRIWRKERFSIQIKDMISGAKQRRSLYQNFRLYEQPNEQASK